SHVGNLIVTMWQLHHERTVRREPTPVAPNAPRAGATSLIPVRRPRHKEEAKLRTLRNLLERLEHLFGREDQPGHINELLVARACQLLEAAECFRFLDPQPLGQDALGPFDYF